MRRPGAAKKVHEYELEVARNALLEQSLQKIVKIRPANGVDPLKLPMKIRFENEPSIDMGGPMKEYFQLVIKEIFSPEFGMFKYNPDTKLYWFDGKTFEPNINFELVGNLMGIAIYNNQFLDIPLAHAIFKIMLDQEPDIDDLA